MICRLRIVRKMWNRHLFRLAISFLQLALSTAIYTYPKKLRIQIHKDLVYQLNSTAAVKEVTLGLCKTSANEFELISYIDMSSFVLAPAYQRRVEYFGNRSIGHIWYKLRNLTQKDNGCYQVQITPITPGAKISILITTVIVTETPQFTAKPNNSIIITEHKDLSINCSAIGPPTPNVIWINVTNNMATVNQGTGFAVLKIPNITRHYNGQIYKCQAENNPNEGPKEASTVLQVNYAPKFKTTFLEKAYCIGDEATLNCSTDGNPTPSFTLDSESAKSGFIYKFRITSDKQFKNYTCNASNEVGSDSYVVRLVKTNVTCQPPVTRPTPEPTNDDVHPGIIAGVVLAGVLAIAGLVIAIILVRRRKPFLKDSTNNTENSVNMNALRDNEDYYATTQQANREAPGPSQPSMQYAVVDKSKKTKKKIPGQGELIYADLDLDGQPDERPSSVRRPTGESSEQPTLYADISGTRQEAPRYGNIQDMDYNI